jgi:DNA-binding NtrC family response regulator
MRTLLLVDDELSILSSLKRLLRRDGYSIVTATNGVEALAVMADHDVGVVVSDGLMREMTGAGLLRKAQELYPDTVRIMLSGYTKPDVVEDAIANCGLFKFLAKPWDDQELVTTIHDAFESYETAHGLVD